MTKFLIFLTGGLILISGALISLIIGHIKLYIYSDDFKNDIGFKEYLINRCCNSQKLYTTPIFVIFEGWIEFLKIILWCLIYFILGAVFTELSFKIGNLILGV